MLLTIEKFGGVVPKILDPSLLSPEKSQIAQNCRFDHGGISPLYTDLLIETLATTQIQVSLFTYYHDGTMTFLSWPTDVDAVKTPILNDTYNRVFYTEGGILKVTDKNLFNQSYTGGTTTTLSIQIAFGGDDTVVYGMGYGFKAFYSTLAEILTGNNSVYTYDTSLLFRNIAIPKGATILSAKVRFVASPTLPVPVGNPPTRFYGDADISGNASAPISYDSFFSKLLTVAHVDWSPSAWVANNTYDSPDLTSIIQEIVNGFNWSFNNNLQLFWEDSGSAVGSYRSPWAYDGDPAKAAILIVTFQIGGTQIGELTGASVPPLSYLIPSPPPPPTKIYPKDITSGIPIPVLGNLCLATTQVTGSLHTYSTFYPTNAFDGDDATYWVGTNFDLGQWFLQYDFGAAFTTSINSLSLVYDDSVGYKGPKDFKLKGSNSGAFAGEETLLYQASSLVWSGTTYTQTFNWFNEAVFRYVRLEITDVMSSHLARPNYCQINTVSMTHLYPTPDLTLQETRGYIYTFVNGYGEEGPPSEVSDLIDVFDGDLVHLSGMATTEDVVYNIVFKNIYRIQQTASGTAQFQFVAQIPLATEGYDDLILDSALGEVCPSLEWDGPPYGIQGLIALPNGVLAGFVDNMVCFSVPNYPHAWPARYQKATDRNVVGLGAFGTNVVALTEGIPYLIVGNDPANSVMEKLADAFSCLSKRGIIHSAGVVIYPSPEGLIGIGPNGLEVLTKDLMTKEQWIARYNPSSISAYYWEGKYIGFYTLGSSKLGFLFDITARDLVDLDFSYDAGVYDITDGTLYLSDDLNNIKAFNQGTSYRTLDYTTRRHKYPMACFGVIKALGIFYPVSISLYFPKMATTVTKNISSEDPARLPEVLTDTCEVSISGTTEVSAIFIASTMEELPL